VTEPAGKLSCAVEKFPQSHSESGSAGNPGWRGRLFGSVAWPGWSGVRPVANDGRPREVPVIAIRPSDLDRDRGRLPWLFPRCAGRCLVSILINAEKKNPIVRDRVSAGNSYQVRPLRREYEPPEEAIEDSEAPERGTRLRVEAPDAGEPQFSHDDRELRHGRSRG
jgi:hypothetical protein